jgi:hypothetical protein
VRVRERVGGGRGRERARAAAERGGGGDAAAVLDGRCHEGQRGGESVAGGVESRGHYRNPPGGGSSGCERGSDVGTLGGGIGTLRRYGQQAQQHGHRVGRPPLVQADFSWQKQTIRKALVTQH